MKPSNTVGSTQVNLHGEDTMSAIARTEYGSPDVLRLEMVKKPDVPDSGVLVRVHAASVNAGDWHLLRGSPFLLRPMFGGMFKPRIKVLGIDIAGRVEAVGKTVTQFHPGDEVFGDLTECGFGAFAEYARATEAALALKPANLTYEEAATVPTAALTALQGLRDVGRLQAGQRVLILGASGGVGSFAVQVAKAWGAEVTAVCSTNKMERVRSLGADHVLDYTQTDVTQRDERYDLIFDAAAFRSVFDYAPILKPTGAYVLVGGSTAKFFQIMLFGSLMSRLCGRQIRYLASKPIQADLIILRELIEAGNVKPFIDRCVTLSDVPNAIRALEQRQICGKIAIRV
jgi:NADPH:quinone reductase-like Zn-dependent oxidoreductase